jgi:hypothetical protein
LRLISTISIQIFFLSFLSPRRYCLTNIKAENDTLRQVAMACFGEEPIPAWVMHEVQGVLVFISVFFICLTLFVYQLLPDLRETQVNT